MRKKETSPSVMSNQDEKNKSYSKNARCDDTFIRKLSKTIGQSMGWIGYFPAEGENLMACTKPLTPIAFCTERNTIAGRRSMRDWKTTRKIYRFSM